MFRRQALSVGSLAAASLLLESTMTRLLAVTQYYHFAFLVVSLALLGYGASGTLLAVVPGFRKIHLNRLLRLSGLGFTGVVFLAYGVINFIPFDAYSIAWDRRQILFFGIYYLALGLPFLMSGLAAGGALSASEGRSHLIYAANLLGSGLGALLAPLVLWLAGVPGAILLSALMGLISTMPLNSHPENSLKQAAAARYLPWVVTLVGSVFFGILTLLNFRSQSPLGLNLSPYKGLTQVMRYPDAEVVFRQWNAISRVDVVVNAGTHHLPGLSYTFQGAVPPQIGYSVDGDSPQPINLVQPEHFEAGDYLPEKLAFELAPAAKTLVLDPGGGLGVLQALAAGAHQVTAVLNNPLEFRAIQNSTSGMNVYQDPRVQTIFGGSRAFTVSSPAYFEVVYIPLTGPYLPVTSGAYSLAEEYSLTIEALEAALGRLSPQGILVLTRWLQTPPSESLRAAGMLVEALAEVGRLDPGDCLVLYRGVQTMTYLVKPSGWSPGELQRVREFTEDRKYDLVWVPDIKAGEVNRYNRLPEPVYHQSLQALLAAKDRAAFYRAYPFDIQPPTDDHPFFFHFFKWEQTPEILATIGHIWQPFGGSGYLVTFALLALTIILSILLILLPLGRLLVPQTKGSRGIRWKALVYFSSLGFAFLFVEIPLIQETILLLEHPTYAFTSVVFTILVFSSLGSAAARHKKLPRRLLMVALVFGVTLLAFAYPVLVKMILKFPFALRIGLVVISLGPTAFLMGLPFPLGLIAVETSATGLTPWVWAVNGGASVVASVLAAILALGYGFTAVLLLGAGLYAGGAMVYIYTLTGQSAKSR